MDKNQRKQLVHQSKRLKVLDNTGKQLLSLLQCADVYPEQVFHTIKTDPILTMNILKLANSPLYRRREEPVDTLQLAITTLGVNLTLRTAFSLALRGALQKNSNSLFDQERFWCKSIIAGWIALNMQASLNGDIRVESLYVACLLQDIGIYSLTEWTGDDYAALFNEMGQHADLVDTERRFFGFDHAEVGAILVEEWGLSNCLIEAIRQSHCLMEHKLVEKKGLCYWVAIIGQEADKWLAVASDISITGMKDTIMDHSALAIGATAALETLPFAEDIFGVDLLSELQIADLIAYYSE